jgi:hypothetical protein
MRHPHVPGTVEEAEHKSYLAFFSWREGVSSITVTRAAP